MRDTRTGSARQQPPKGAAVDKTGKKGMPAPKGEKKNEVKGKVEPKRSVTRGSTPARAKTAAQPSTSQGSARSTPGSLPQGIGPTPMPTPLTPMPTPVAPPSPSSNTGKPSYPTPAQRTAMNNDVRYAGRFANLAGAIGVPSPTSTPGMATGKPAPRSQPPTAPTAPQVPTQYQQPSRPNPTLAQRQAMNNDVVYRGSLGFNRSVR